MKIRLMRKKNLLNAEGQTERLTNKMKLKSPKTILLTVLKIGSTPKERIENTPYLQAALVSDQNK